MLALAVMAVVGPGVDPADALLRQLVKTTTTVVDTTTATTTSVLDPVTQAIEPVTTTTGSVTESTGGLIGGVLEPLPEPPSLLPAGYDPISPLLALLSGTQGLPTTLEQIACPPVEQAAQLLGTIGDGLATLVCRAGTLEYGFYTRLRTASGDEVARRHVATLGVPTPLDVDQDLGPDLIGTITLTGVNSVGLVIDRMPTETAELPVSVEAVLRDPTRGSLGREHLAFGYDARDDRAPGQFVLSTPVDTILQPTPSFRIDIAQRSPGAKVAVTGAIFDGPVDERMNPAEVRLAYGRSPMSAGILAEIGGDEAAVSLTTPTGGPASISGRIVDVTEEQRFAANLADLPPAFAVAAAVSGTATNATLTASQRIPRLDGSFERVRNIGPEPLIARKALFDLEDVPQGVQIAFSGEQGSVTTTGGPIGHARIGTANGEPVFLVGERAYVKLHEAGALSSVAAAIPGLSSAAFTLGDAPRVSAEIAPTPFLVRIARTGRELGADILDLPARFDLGLDLAEGRLSYDGHGSGIGRIVLAGDGTEPLFARATKLRATLDGIPAAMTAQFGGDAGSGRLEVQGGAIDRVELVASNGSEELPAGTGQGVVYRDVTGGDYVLAARILGLRRVALTNGDAVALQTHTAGGPFSLVAQTDELTATGTVADLPAKADVTAALQEGRIAFQGRDAGDQPAGIARLDLDVASTAPLFGRADHLRAHLGDIPPELTLGLAAQGQGVHATASRPVGLVEVVAREGAIADFQGDLPANGEQGARLTDRTGGGYVAAARIRSLERLAVGLDGTAVALDSRTAGGPFGVTLDTDDLSGEARIEDLPEQLAATLDLAAGKLTVAGRDGAGAPRGIDRITLDLHGADALFGRATDLHANVTDVPADVTLQLAQEGGGVRIETDNPIGLIELVADSEEIADPQVLLPAGGGQGAVYRDTPGRFTVAARVRELRRLTADLGSTFAVTARTAGGPFSVLAETGGMTVDARLLDMPADVEATLDPAGGTFAYRGRDADGTPRGIDLVTVDVAAAQPFMGRATTLSARFQKLAPAVDLALDPAGSRVSVEASAPIELVEVLAGEGATALPAPLDDPAVQGAVLHDTAGAPYVAALRVRELRRVTLAFGEQLAVDALTAGGPFVADVATDDLAVDARVLDLPPDASLAMDLAGGVVRFSGRDAQGAPRGIDLLTIDGRLTGSIFGRAERLSARIERLPGVVEVGFSQTAGRASLQATAPIELIELFAWEAGNPQPALAADQGARLHDRPGEPFELAARVRRLEQLSLDFAGPLQLTTKTAGGLFEADVRTETLDVDATIDRLPTELSLGFDLAAGRVTYAGSSPIDRIVAAIRSAEPAFMNATAFEVDLKQVPQAFELGLGSETERIRLTADNPIGQIDLRARSAGREYPAVPAGEAGAILDSTGGQLALALRVFALETLDVSLAPMALEAEMQGGRRFLVDADVQQDDGSVLRLDGVIDQLPARVRLALEDVLSNGTPNGSRLVLDGSAPIGFVRLGVRGLELLPGADQIDAEINDLPESLTVTLPETGSLARVEARNAAGAAAPIGQLRLAASNGSKTLPAFVSDAQYNANPSNAAYRDRLEFDNSPTTFGVALRLTAPKVIDVNLDPIALTLEQDGTRTRPIAIDARIPNSEPGKPATTVTGLLNKPSARTVLGVEVLPDQPTRLTFDNAAAVGSLSLNAANLGSIPSASFSLANIPRRLSVCMDTSSACRPTASNRIPAALSNYGGAHRSPTQSATAGGQNRPYPALVSMNFEDHGTSGTSSAIGSMVTLNANITLEAGQPPITITNLRFHNLALDLGDHPTNKSFSYLGGTVPRIYMFMDSLGQPFALNEVKYPPTIESFKIGTDGSPATATRRLVWLPGTQCTASVFGACIATGLDTRTTGSLNCGGQRALTVKLLGVNINLLNFLGIQILPVCN